MLNDIKLRSDLFAARALARELKRRCVDRNVVQLYALPSSVLQACRLAGLDQPVTTVRRFQSVIDRFVTELEALQRDRRRYAELGIIARTIAVVRRRPLSPQPLSSSSSLFLEAARRRRQVHDQHRSLVTAARQIRDLLLSSAIALQASSLHLELNGVELRIRYRIDGGLYEASRRRLRAPRSVLIEMMNLVGLDSEARDRPQSGRGILRAGGEDIRAAVDVLPTLFGESVVVHFVDVVVERRHHHPLKRPPKTDDVHFMLSPVLPPSPPPSPPPPPRPPPPTPMHPPRRVAPAQQRRARVAGAMTWRVELTGRCSPQPMWAPGDVLKGLNESKLALMHATALQLAIERGQQETPTLDTFAKRVMRVVLAFQRVRGCSAVEIELWDDVNGRLVIEPIAAGVAVTTEELAVLLNGIPRAWARWLDGPWSL